MIFLNLRLTFLYGQADIEADRTVSGARVRIGGGSQRPEPLLHRSSLRSATDIEVVRNNVAACLYPTFPP